MLKQRVNLQFTINWIRPSGRAGPYRWGDEKGATVDSNWGKANVIYRWVKDSTKETAVVGETERTISARVDNYTSAKPGHGAGSTNKKVHAEQQRLNATGDSLYLEFIDRVPGYDLNDKRERRFAEKLITGIIRPYLR